MFKGKIIGPLWWILTVLLQKEVEIIFYCKNNIVITPEGRNCLVGISRNYIFEIETIKIRCIEKISNHMCLHRGRGVYYGTLFVFCQCLDLTVLM